MSKVNRALRIIDIVLLIFTLGCVAAAARVPTRTVDEIIRSFTGDPDPTEQMIGERIKRLEWIWELYVLELTKRYGGPIDQRNMDIREWPTSTEAERRLHSALGTGYNIAVLVDEKGYRDRELLVELDGATHDAATELAKILGGRR